MIEKLRTFYLYRKIVFSFLLINIISIIFISSALYIVFSKTSRKEIYGYSMDRLVQMDSSVCKLYEGLFPVINYILVSDYSASFMEAKVVDRLGEFRLMESLKVLKTANEHLKFIGVVNLATDRYLGTRGVYFGVEEEIKNEISQNTEESFYCIPRTVRREDTSSGENGIEVLTFIYAPRSRYPQGYILIEVEKQYFRDLFQGAEETDKQEAVFLINSEEEILIETQEESSGKFADIISEDLQGQFENSLSFYEKEIEGEMYSVVYLQSGIPSWYFISIRPKAETMPKVREMLFLIIRIVFLMMAVNIVVTFFLAKYIYNPLGKLYHRLKEEKGTEEKQCINEVEVLNEIFAGYEQKNAYLENFKQNTSRILSNSWLKSIVRKEIVITPDSELPEYFEYEFPEGYYYRVLLFSFEDYEEFNRKYQEKDWQAIEFAISNMAEELIGKYCVNESVKVAQNQYMLILKLSGSFMPNEVLLGIRELQNVFLKYINILINASYGGSFHDWREIPISYESACNGLRKRLFLGKGVIIEAEYDYGRSKKQEYPRKIVKNIEEAIRLDNQKKVEQEIEKYIANIKTMDAENIIGYTGRACYELIQNCALETSDLRSYSMNDIHKRICEVDEMAVIQTVLLQLSIRILAQWKEKKEKDPSKDPVVIAQNYIHEHYMDLDLSVEYLANLVGLSSSYFGKLFHNSLHQSCSEYITDVRLERANDMLLRTNKTVSAISQEVGVSSTNYFYMLFKKKYGCTPAQFRQQKIKEK